jgi:uncharacterized protein YunC (DUF1805 family)
MTAISLFGFKLDLTVLILIGVIYLVMVVHTMCGCCNMQKVKEGLENPVKGIQNLTDDINKAVSTVGKKAEDITKKVEKKVKDVKETFVGANTNYGESSRYDLNNNTVVDSSSWSMPNLSVVKGQPLSAGVQQILDREPQPVPLPEDELLMFANTPFKPECCPNTYSNSSGCACMTTGQYNYLILRGGNNTPYSEY